MWLRLPLAILAIAALGGYPEAGQGTGLLDQGSFSITVRGQRVGREDFTIRTGSQGVALTFVAQATVQYRERQLAPLLVADSAGVPLSYEITVRTADDATEVWKGSIVRGRMSARIQTGRGQVAREYIIPDGTLIVDDEVFHQYYFVARQRGRGSVNVLSPRSNTQSRLAITSGGEERLQIGPVELQATHLVLTDASGAQRDLWIDAEGRILRVVLPAAGIVATRDDPPRQPR
jgi:hypothetical protein